MVYFLRIKPPNSNWIPISQALRKISQTILREKHTLALGSVFRSALEMTVMMRLTSLSDRRGTSTLTWMEYLTQPTPPGKNKWKNLIKISQKCGS